MSRRQPPYEADSDEYELGRLIGWPRKTKLPAAQVLGPLQHGAHCPGLSGLYSIVNGIRLAFYGRYHFSDRELTDLIAAGLRFLHGRLTPERAVTCGLPSGLWLRLARALIERVQRQIQLPLFLGQVCAPGLERLAVWQAMEVELLRGLPLIMLVRGGRYTVVCGFTPASFLLFDSGEACWITKQSSGVAGEVTAARHVISPATVVALHT